MGQFGDRSYLKGNDCGDFSQLPQIPRKAQSSNLKPTPLTLDSIDSFVFYDKPFLTFERLLETYFATAPKGFLSFVKAIPVWLSTKLFLKETIARELESLYKKLYPQKSKQEIKAFKQKVLNNLYFSEHHLSHCGSAFFPSPFSDAGILTLDGIGEWATTTIAKGQDNYIEILQELHFPHSLGLLYSAFTYYLGFKVNSGEYKVMGLAPYGEPKFVDIIKTHLVDIKPDGSFSLNMEYFSYTYGLRMTNAKFDSLFHAQRNPESKLEQIHMDIAASLQVVTEEIMIALARTTARLSGSRNLVLSGGVALNCVGNGKIYQKLIKEEKILDHIWIQPASGDAGSAVGCALAFYHIECKQPRIREEKQAKCEKADSSNETQNVSEPTKDSRSFTQNAENVFCSQADRRQDFCDKNGALQGEARELPKAVMTEAELKAITILAKKPTPKISPSNSKILELESGFSNATNIKGSQAEGFADDFVGCARRAVGEGIYLSGNEQAHRADSRKSVAKPTPLLKDSMQGSYLGLSYSNEEVQATLDSLNAVYEKHHFDTIKHLTAEALAQGKVVGWHQGRCEFGPRALGARSILGDPRNTTMQKTMNLKIKYRESFRPFAPSVLDFAINEWFECDYISPYMLLVAPVKREKCYPLTKEQKELFGIEKLNIIRSEIPSVTHIDYSARIQSVHKETNPRYYALIEEFYKLSGVPVLVNTSFNVRGEPMVCSPYDSYACFMGTEMDMLVIEDFILYKEKQPQEHIAKFRDIKDKYELD
ncbi:carbamoyltransferase N-terminal domain-containing protein [Helicobacter bilis]|uniref:Carbamoyl transferase n=1 Tax=Helicobacter bilis TaxID=37372 RepID=A0A4U8U9W4_9HELI|nr:carbamoyltransferase N-terminal domain-containing protein [Helicobacter bilis]MCI7411649.1 carbamoyl transferase [Helicobacter bilis]MDD7295904.1 carbamoyltransferase N-terminal domain-containing protein [Helicobacter bilis]TLE10567.1 carbamoyl transferase [Helicobacter bilis]